MKTKKKTPDMGVIIKWVILNYKLCFSKEKKTQLAWEVVTNGLKTP